MSDRRPLIAGNWKMNGLRREAIDLAGDLARRMAAGRAAFEMVLCPPFPMIEVVLAAVRGSPIAVGGQDCHAEPKGAFTGDVAAAMLADLGCRFVIVGHSERRTLHGETDATVHAKARAAIAARLCAIVCVGESEAERDVGTTMAVVARQLAQSLPVETDPNTVVVAYEPVWAIGSGRTPTADEVQAVHAFIRREVAGRFGEATARALQILYGGSVKPSNAGDLLTLPDVDGGLVGGASLKAADFWAIAQSCV